MMKSNKLNAGVAAIPDKLPLNSRLSIQRDAVLDLLKQMAIDNEVYFRQFCNNSLYNGRISDCCQELASSIDLMREIICRLQNASKKCDYDEKTPGNGFRSLVCINDVVVLHLVSVLRVCSENRGVMMFRLSHYCKEIEAYAAMFRFLILAYQQVISLLDVLDEDSLFPSLDGDYQQYNIMFRGIESLDGSCFYGRPLGFQFFPTVTRIFRVIGLVLATYSLSWENSSAAFSSLINSGKMLLNPEQRAKRIITVTRDADINFCRGFWNLSELPMSRLLCPIMAVCEVNQIKPAGPLPLEARDGGHVLIPEPSAHTGVRPVAIRILSYHHRIGLSPSNCSNRQPLSPHLLIHCHGGGFVATSSKSHETYLRYWAKSLNCPVVSIDYSLSPENPFPRPTEEVLYAYAWMLNNPEKFGWTGERVCLVGDSAGGNLIVSVSLRLVELGVKRMPDGLVPIYTPFLFQYLPSPSRVLSFMDPLLHMGVVIRCAAAYTGTFSDEELDKNCSFNANTTSSSARNGHRSLQEYVDQVQRVQRENQSLLDFSGSQSIVSLINLSFLNKSLSSSKSLELSPEESSKTAKSKELTLGGGGEQMEEETDGGGQAELEQIQAAALVEEEDSPDNTVQSVRVDADPAHICLSSTNFDQCLIDYLQMHPITRSSIHNLPESMEVDHAAPVEAPVPDLSSELNGAEDVFHEDGLISGVSPRPLSKSLTAGSSKRSTPIGSLAALHTPDIPNGKNSSLLYNSPGSSIGHTPYNRKQRLSRNSKSRSLSQSLADTAALAAGHAMDNLSDWLDAPMEPLGFSDKKKLTRAAKMTPLKAAQVQQEEALSHHSHFTELLKLNLPRDHLMSPMYAPSELLAKLPPFRFVGCHLDPLLDDTIMFARRVRDSGGRVISVDLLDSLPHGFLNFAPMSVDCQNGSNLCLERIKETLGI